METVQLLAVGPESSVIPVSFEIIGGDEAGLRMKVSDGEWCSYFASNLFKCLMNARMDLEKEGLLLCCQGARPDAFPSGMQQQMELGRFATVLSRSPEEREVVDIFGSAEASQVTSVESQRIALYRFYNLPIPDADEDA